MTTTIGTIELIAKIDTSQYKKGASEIDRTNKDIQSSSQRSSKGIGSNFNNAAKVATAAIVAAGGVIVGTFIDSASQIQSLRASFESLTGSVTDTNKVMSTLYELGKKTAFSNKDIQSAGRNYLAAGVSVEKLQTVLKNTADIAGATGADLGQLTLPLTQTIARGKLQTQDFYQILNSGAGALRKPLTELAGKKGFGSLAEAMEKGAITSDDLLKVMSDVTKEGGFAFNGAIKQSETFNGRMSNLREAITNVGLSILGVDAVTGQVDPSGPFAKLSNAVSSATDFLTRNQNVIKQVGMVISILLVPAIISLGVQSLIAGAKMAAGILLALGPIGLIIAAVAAIAALIIANWDTVKGWLSSFWEWLKKTGSSAWNGLQSAISTVWNWVKNNWPLLLAILTGPIGIAVGLIIKNFDKIKSAASSVWNFIKNTFDRIKGIPGQMINAFKNIGTGLANAIKDALNRILHLPLTIPEVNVAGKKVGGQTLIPALAQGGIVSTPTLAMIGEGREPEAVVPLSKLDKMIRGEDNNGNGTTINQVNNIYSQVDMDVALRDLSWRLAV